MLDKNEAVAGQRKRSLFSKLPVYLAFFFRRLSASPVLIGLLSVAAVWVGISNFWQISKLGNDIHRTIHTKMTTPPPAPRNLAFEQRIGMDKHPHDKNRHNSDIMSQVAESAHGFNTKASEKLGPRLRELPDTVPKACSFSEMDSLQKRAPTISVIIAFHNEHFVTLARTVVSILHRTPERILAEVLLVNDGSTKTDLLSQLSEFLSKSVEIVKTKVINLEGHEGIVAARLAGAKEAKGEVLVFIESHAEPNVGWIEPLLTLIEDGKKRGDKITIAVPVIDIIDDQTFAYRASPAVRGGFDWDVVFKWEYIGDSKVEVANGIQYIQSPAFSGGVFAVDRQQFFDTGAYDEYMHEWGAENVELSLRASMCGGRVLISPCSRVGHVFRRRAPTPISSHPGPGIDDPSYWFAYNALRTALVWFTDEGDDKYLQFFYAVIPEAKQISPGDLSARKELKKSLKCKSFRWYLENLYPDHPEAPSMSNAGDVHRLNLDRPIDELSPNKAGRDSLASYIDRSRRSGHLFHVMSRMCVSLGEGNPVRNVPPQVLPGDSTSYTCLTLSKCEKTRYQRWFETWQGDLILDKAGCLAWSAAYSPAIVVSVCPPLIAKPKSKQDGNPTRKIFKSNKWRWLDGFTSSQLQVVVEGSSLSEKCLVARHFPTMCDDARCGTNNTVPPPRTANNVCAVPKEDDFELVLEPCSSDHNQLFQLLDF